MSRECNHCHQVFQTSRLDQGFCSKRCNDAARTGKGSSYSTNRQIAMVRDGHKCRACGHTLDLECHHVLGLAKGGTHQVDNLVILCEPCHLKAHRVSRQAEKTGKLMVGLKALLVAMAS